MTTHKSTGSSAQHRAEVKGHHIRARSTDENKEQHTFSFLFAHLGEPNCCSSAKYKVSPTSVWLDLWRTFIQVVVTHGGRSRVVTTTLARCVEKTRHKRERKSTALCGIAASGSFGVTDKCGFSESQAPATNIGFDSGESGSSSQPKPVHTHMDGVTSRYHVAASHV